MICLTNVSDRVRPCQRLYTGHETVSERVSACQPIPPLTMSCFSWVWVCWGHVHLKCGQVACVSIRFGGKCWVSRSGCRTLFAMGAPAPEPSKGKGKPLSKGDMVALKGKLAALKGKGKLVGKMGREMWKWEGQGSRCCWKCCAQNQWDANRDLH